MDKSLNKHFHTSPDVDANKNIYKIEEQQDGNTIKLLDKQPVNSMSNDEQVCIYNLSMHQSFVYFDYILKREAYIYLSDSNIQKL
jgi:hypothetical protein